MCPCLRQDFARTYGASNSYVVTSNNLKQVLDCRSAPPTSEPMVHILPSSVIKNKYAFAYLFFMVPEAGLEPVWYCYHWHLKPARLPIPPLGQ